MFDRCADYKWKNIFRFKEGRIKSVAEEFYEVKWIEENDTYRDIFWMNQIAYHEHMLNVLEKPADKTNENQYPYLFLTNIKITKRNAQRLVIDGELKTKDLINKKYSITH